MYLAVLIWNTHNGMIQDRYCAILTLPSIEAEVVYRVAGWHGGSKDCHKWQASGYNDSYTITAVHPDATILVDCSSGSAL